MRSGLSWRRRKQKVQGQAGQAFCSSAVAQKYVLRLRQKQTQRRKRIELRRSRERLEMVYNPFKTPTYGGGERSNPSTVK